MRVKRHGRGEEGSWVRVGATTMASNVRGRAQKRDRRRQKSSLGRAERSRRTRPTQDVDLTRPLVLREWKRDKVGTLLDRRTQCGRWSGSGPTSILSLV